MTTISLRTITVALLTTLLLSGCVYRLAIQQGNIAELEDVEQVKVGMTPSQVRFLLGTPLVDDPFNDNRWDYVFQSRVGRNKPVTRQFMTVYFEDGKVSRIETPDLPPKEGDQSSDDSEDTESEEADETA
ncbi:MAG: outer membrane protein assembly factor BamE [Pseudomonadota bacterium]